MSIPNTFRPVCGARETWLPYVQPIMTSATTWSNEPSFGLAWQGVWGYAGYGDWKCMSASGQYWWSNGFSPRTALLTFEKPLRIDAVMFSDGDGDANSYARVIAFEAKVEGEWRVLGEWTRPESMPTTKGIRLDLRRVVAREYRVTNSTKTPESGYGVLNELKLEAYYRP